MMYDTILSFYKTGERPFVESALWMGRYEDEVRRRHEEDGLNLGGPGVPFEVRGEPYSGDETLMVHPSGLAEEHIPDIAHLKSCIVWWEVEGWCTRGAEAIYASTRAHLSETLEANGERAEGGDLLLLEAIDTGPPALQAEEEATHTAIRRAFEDRSLYALRRALYEYVSFYEGVQEQLAAGDSDTSHQLSLTEEDGADAAEVFA